MVGQESPDLLVELGDHLGGSLRPTSGGRRPPSRLRAHDLRVRLGDGGVETFAAKHHEHAVLGLVDELHFHTFDADPLSQRLDYGRSFVVGKAARPTVGDAAFGVEGCNVGSGGDVPRLEHDLQPGGRQGTPAELELQRVVAEEAEVARSTSGGDSRTDRLDEPDGALGGQRIEVGGAGFFQLGVDGRRRRSRRDRP